MQKENGNNGGGADGGGRGGDSGRPPTADIVPPRGTPEESSDRQLEGEEEGAHTDVVAGNDEITIIKRSCDRGRKGWQQ